MPLVQSLDLSYNRDWVDLSPLANLVRLQSLTLTYLLRVGCPALQQRALGSPILMQDLISVEYDEEEHLANLVCWPSLVELGVKQCVPGVCCPLLPHRYSHPKEQCAPLLTRFNFASGGGDEHWGGQVCG